MDRLEGVTVKELHECLDRVEGKTATLRIVVGINYKNDITQSELAEWYGVTRTTIHNWLDRLERLENESLEDVIYDDHRPGRPPKLTADQQEWLESILQAPPDEWGVDANAWSVRLIKRLIADQFDVEYTPRHVRILMNRAGVTLKNEQSTQFEDSNRALDSIDAEFPSPPERDG